ncbi:MAG: pilus assembly protein [Chloroflexi bacterium]|nr:pilus assembly protein [Chloroflexota bacterium]
MSRKLSKALLKNQSGQGLLEYALIIMLVGIVVILILILLGPAIGNLYSSVIHALP